jgi:acyl-coenzyme A synthetase/AMP-(fatty) acid ligase
MGEQVAETFNFARHVMEQGARRRPHDAALWWVDEAGTARCYSFAKLADRFRRASRFLHKAGIRCGDRVLVMQPRVPAWWIVMPDFGAVLARAREQFCGRYWDAVEQIAPITRVVCRRLARNRMLP